MTAHDVSISAGASSTVRHVCPRCGAAGRGVGSLGYTPWWRDAPASYSMWAGRGRCPNSSARHSSAGLIGWRQVRVEQLTLTAATPWDGGASAAAGGVLILRSGGGRMSSVRVTLGQDDATTRAAWPAPLGNNATLFGGDGGGLATAAMLQIECGVAGARCEVEVPRALCGEYSGRAEQ